jgi:hypothetical protein
MTVKIIPNENGNPPGKLADAELHFTDGPLAALKLIGFAIWERRTGGGRNVTFPARQYSVNGERRSFALLRPIADATAQDRIRDTILQAYAEYEGLATAEVIGPPSAFAHDLATAIRNAPAIAEAPFALSPTAAPASAVQPSRLK